MPFGPHARSSISVARTFRALTFYRNSAIRATSAARGGQAFWPVAQQVRTTDEPCRAVTGDGNTARTANAALWDRSPDRSLAAGTSRQPSFLTSSQRRGKVCGTVADILADRLNLTRRDPVQVNAGRYADVDAGRGVECLGGL